MKGTKLVAGLVTLFLLAGAATAYGAKVHLALPVESIDFLPVYIAQEKGFFAQQGLEATVTVLRGGGGVIAALVSGDIDFGFSSTTEVALLKQRGVDTRFVMATTDNIPFSLIARKDLGAKKVTDLKGRSISITGPGSLTHAMLLYVLVRNGLNPEKDVTIVPIGGGAEAIGALKTKKIDASMLFEPFVAMAVIEGVATEVLDTTTVVKAWPANSPIAKKSYIDANADTVARLSKAMLQALDYVRANPAGAREVAAKKFSGMRADVLEAALNRYFPFYSRSGVVTREHIEVSQEILLKGGLIKSAFPYESMVMTPAR